ncbi:potassium-transporting ATPase subunit C [Solibacillus sp. R5-41]|uniref:potassium-transporting ATPase subunit KdpC n=1 Tax=Solibacillus sp. R5-41 TaxID=2048654 RepID=UPI000C128BD6|nr:potassium-transporting ATPase subunit KdpC [Solibacillus sp. R5-41]ATP39915.1 potassium-transporting ATPase subunit C [Solibacillus sp. R5-41]
MKLLKGTLSRSIVFFFIFTFICGVVYPVTMTGMAQIVFPEKANGSIIEVEGKNYGSALLGQQFTGDTHMWGRIMQIDTATYKDAEGNPLMYAFPANLSPASEEYGELIAERVTKIQAAHPEKATMRIPVDLVTSSGSGLDPSISVAAANYQIERLAKNNNLSIEEVKFIIEQCSESRFLGVFGEVTVNVLKVNLMLDGILEY